MDALVTLKRLLGKKPKERHEELHRLVRELPVKSENCSESFCLDDNISFTVINEKPEQPRWLKVSYFLDKRKSLILRGYEELVFLQRMTIVEDSMLFVRYGATWPDISKEGFDVELVFTEAGGSVKSYDIAQLAVHGGKQPNVWKTAEFNLSSLAGKNGFFSLLCKPRPTMEGSGNCLALSEFSFARQDLLPLYKAKSFKSFRLENELKIFNEQYQHKMYADKHEKQKVNIEGASREVKQFFVPGNKEALSPEIVLQTVEPVNGETAYEYAGRLLAAQLPQDIPDYLHKLQQRAAGGNPVKVLSLCSGAARVEAGYAAQLPKNVEWSLLDINPDLLERASQQFAPDVQVDLLKADINDLYPTGKTWDVILCVSALHHVVELETLVSFCYQSLNPGGEFWSIGENVGRNGNRLWPEARDAANKVFRELPEKYRMNRYSNEIDEKIPDKDYSCLSFEGIRSEEIEHVIDRWFVPVTVSRRNCFLWLITNLVYSENYDLNDPVDLEWINRLVEHEVRYFLSGGLGSELYGVYAPRTFQI